MRHNPHQACYTKKRKSAKLKREDKQKQMKRRQVSIMEPEIEALADMRRRFVGEGNV